ncbi:MAG: class I SAM-dependent methyltransferase [Bryobacteraceae bacterium]
MQTTNDLITPAAVKERARQSRGISNDAILQMVVGALQARDISGGCFVDVGCGAGNLYHHVRERFARYVGVDAVRYEDFPARAEFCYLDLDSGRMPLPDGSGDVVAAVEVIEHLENPRDFMRKLVGLAAPGGWIVVTTPNQLSLLSLASLVIKQRFLAFQDIHYPTHLTALLEIDLRRIAAECNLANVAIEYSRSGRIPLTARAYPRWLSRTWPRAFSENVLLIGQRQNSGQRENE